MILEEAQHVGCGRAGRELKKDTASSMNAKDQYSQRVEIVQAVVKYQDMIKGYSYAIVRDFHLAEDVCQQVALIVAKNWESVPPEDQLAPWLRETTRRKSLEALRRHHRMPSTLPEEILEAVAEEFTVEQEETEHDRLYALMERCLGRLKGTARTVIEARYGEIRPHSCKEIAGQLGRSVQAVYSIIKRARLALTRCVEQLELQNGPVAEL